MNPISPVLRIKIRNKLFTESEKELKHGEFEDDQKDYGHALISLLRDGNIGAIQNLVKILPDSDEKFESMYLIALHGIAKDDKKLFTRYRRDLSDISKLPYPRVLYSILQARRKRMENQYEIALSFLTEGEKLLSDTTDFSKLEVLAQLKFEEGLNHIHLKQYHDAMNAYEKGIDSIYQIDAPLIRGRLLSAIGDLQETLENFQEAATYYQHSINELIRCEDPLPATYVKIKVAQLMEDFDNYTEAEAILTDILNTIRDQPDIEAYAHSTIGRIFNATERYDESLEHYLKAIDIQKLKGNNAEVAVIENSIGNLFNSQEKYEDAIRYYLKSLEYWKETGDFSYLATIEVNIGKVYYEMANFEKAIEFFEKSVETQMNLDTKYSILSSYNNLASVCLEFGQLEQARKYLTLIHETSEEYKDDRLLAVAYTSFAVIALIDNDLGRLEQYLVQARDHGYSSGDINIMVDTSINLGICYFHMKESKLAENIMWQALDYGKDANDNFSVFECLEYLRRLNYKINKRRITILEEIEIIEKEMGYGMMDWELILDQIVAAYVIEGREEALERLKGAVDNYVPDLMGEDSLFRKLVLCIREESPDDIFRSIISTLLSGIEKELILQPQSIRISQFLLNLYNVYQEELSDDLFQPLQNLMIHAGELNMREVEICTKFILNKLSGSMISDIDGLTVNNWLDVLSNPMTWINTLDNPIDPVFISLPNISIMQFSLSSQKIDKNELSYMLMSSKRLIDFHLEQLKEADYLKTDGEDLILTEEGKRKFIYFSSTIQGKLLTRIAA